MRNIVEKQKQEIDVNAKARRLKVLLEKKEYKECPSGSAVFIALAMREHFMPVVEAPGRMNLETANFLYSLFENQTTIAMGHLLAGLKGAIGGIVSESRNEDIEEYFFMEDIAHSISELDRFHGYMLLNSMGDLRIHLEAQEEGGAR